MEKIKLIRKEITDTHTFGELWYNDKFICYTLEDPVREFKIKHQTAIPYGTYQVILNLSPRFKQIMPRLLNVPNYSGVLIHKGNTTEDTSGCILVGEIKHGNKLIYSALAYSEVFALIKNLLKKGDLFIEIIKEEKKVIKEELPKTETITQVVIETPQIELPIQKKSILWKSYSPNLFKLILNFLKKLLFPKLGIQQ